MKASELKEYGAVRHNPDGSVSLVSLDGTLIKEDVTVDELIFNGSYVNLKLNGFEITTKKDKQWGGAEKENQKN